MLMTNVNNQRINPSMKEEAKQLIEVCRAITADGKLVFDEVWYLANWLNDHPTVMQEWPGSLFVEPLNRVFADGQLTEQYFS